MKKTGNALLRHYKLHARSAHYHANGCWYWSLRQFPGVYFDASGYVVFSTEKNYSECEYLQIGPVNTRVRDEKAGISGIPGYVKLDPTPISLQKVKCSYCGAIKLIPERYIKFGDAPENSPSCESSSRAMNTSNEFGLV